MIAYGSILHSERQNPGGMRRYLPMTRNNYYKLKEILEAKGIKLVCVQYPMRSVDSLKKM